MVIAQLTSGTREAHAILVEHVTPFNNALQMPNVTGLIDMTTTTGKAMMDTIVTMQAQIIAFSHDYALVMFLTGFSVPLALLIGSTKASLRKQTKAPDHAAVME